MSSASCAHWPPSSRETQSNGRDYSREKLKNRYYSVEKRRKLVKFHALNYLVLTTPKTLLPHTAWQLATRSLLVTQISFLRRGYLCCLKRPGSRSAFLNMCIWFATALRWFQQHMTQATACNKIFPACLLFLSVCDPCVPDEGSCKSCKSILHQLKTVPESKEFDV